MKRMLCIASSAASACVVAAVTVGAQTATTTSTTTADQHLRSAKNEIKILGCVARDNEGHFILKTSDIGKTPSTLEGGAVATSGSLEEPWMLHGSKVARHVGQQVEVKGHVMKNQQPASATTGDAKRRSVASDSDDFRDLQVTSITATGGRCS
jgi:hypothetical protein